MKRTIAFCLLVATFIVFFFSSVNDLTRVIAQVRYKSTSFLGSDKYTYGDLYGFCYLSKFRVKNPKGPYNPVRFDTTDIASKKIDLYALSDSYGWEALSQKSLFYHVNKIVFAKQNYKEIVPTTLDRSKKNILLLECSERNIRLVYEDTAYLKHFFEITTEPVKSNGGDSPNKPAPFRFNFKLNNIDANVEFNTWDYRFLTPFKEFKSDLYFKLFNRISKGAYVSPDEKYLLYDLTIDTTNNKQSAFNPIGSAELKGIITALNNTYDSYRAKGFDEVYLSIVPNPVSILYPNFRGNTYNQLLSLVQNDKALKCKVIDLYSPFRQSRQQLYCTSDSHWNYNGEKIWLTKINDILKSYK